MKNQKHQSYETPEMELSYYEAGSLVCGSFPSDSTEDYNIVDFEW